MTESTRTNVPVPVKAFGAILAAYLVVRGFVELFAINYGDPASFRNDWGGPSLAGVLAVHTGPGLLVLAWLAVRVARGRS